MIKFFRRIRQQLMAENNFSKYLLYAVGEIILVVVGILLALQINTWNQQRVEDEKEIELLNELKEEFQYNLAIVNESIVVNGKVAQSCVELTKRIRANTLIEAPARVDSLLMVIGNFNSFDARTGISKEIVNSGKLALFKNDALRERLGNWLTLLEDCEEDIRFRSDHYTVNLMPFLMKRFPLANGERYKAFAFDSKNYLKRYQEISPFTAKLTLQDFMEFENQIWLHKHNHDYVVINELNTRDFILDTIALIEDELRREQ